MLKKILRGAGSDAIKYFPVRFVPALTSLITVPVFTRAIATADYGDFFLVQSATSLLATLGAAWLATSAMRFYWPAEKEGRLDEYTATTLWASVSSLAIVAMTAGVAVWLARAYLPAGVVRLAPIGLAALVINQLVTVHLQELRAANKAAAFSLLSVSVTLLTTAIAVFLVVVPRWGAQGILAGAVLGNAIVLPLALSRIRHEGSLSPRHVRRSLLREYAHYGFPMIATAVSSWALVLADRYVIGALRSSAEVGLYSVAYGLGDKIMQLLIMPLMMTMGPVVIQTFEKEGQHLAEKVQTQFTRYYAMATFPLLFGLVAVARDFMNVFTGEAYRAAYPVLPIVAAGVTAYGLTQIAGQGVALHKRTTIIMGNTLIAAAFNVGANLALVPRFGYMAAAYDTLASYILLLALTWYRSRPYMAWKLPWLDLAKALAAALGMWTLLHFAFPGAGHSPWLLVAQAASGLGAYAILLLLFGGLRADEREWVLEVASKAVRKLTLR